MLGSALSNQVGAALGAHAFGALGPPGVVAVRQVVAASVLLPAARPPLRRMTWPQWWPALLLAAVFGGMNLALYTAIDRLGLGLAVTLEFLGPLGVALAGFRSRRDLLIAAAAAAGVYVLVLPGPSSDYLGSPSARWRRLLGGLHRAQPRRRRPPARAAGAGGGDGAVRADLPAGARPGRRRRAG